MSLMPFACRSALSAVACSGSVMNSALKEVLPFLLVFLLFVAFVFAFFNYCY